MEAWERYLLSLPSCRGKADRSMDVHGHSCVVLPERKQAKNVQKKKFPRTDTSIKVI